MSPACPSLDEPEQLDLFSDHEKREKLRRLDAATDAIRDRFGFGSIARGLTLAEPSLGGSHGEDSKVSSFGIEIA